MLLVAVAFPSAPVGRVRVHSPLRQCEWHLNERLMHADCTQLSMDIVATTAQSACRPRQLPNSCRHQHYLLADCLLLQPTEITFLKVPT